MEGSGSQHKYLINEDQAIGKNRKTAHGHNTVISMLQHHFKNHCMGKKCALCCDNCPGICSIISYSCALLFLLEAYKGKCILSTCICNFYYVICFLFARNTDQNKTKNIIGYLLWWVMIGLNRATDLHMQIQKVTWNQDMHK